MLASGLAPLITEGACLVPVPRSSWRHLRYGLDPAPDLARRLRILIGCDVVSALAAPVFAHRQAGRKRADRQFLSLTVTSRPPSRSVIIIDDVLTTGRTLNSANFALQSAGVRVDSAITATARGD
jgi:predicted amidophosphoribosyltransferase